jgi:tRNA (mo5U34)-methyltransferase
MLPTMPWPPLAGKRCLDVGTFDGFWAFEMERRGAAEVVGIDVLDPAKWDWPVGSPADVVAEVGKRKAGGVGFEIAREALGSSVKRVELSVYDLSPEVLGTFDFVYVGSILLHLRDPVRALERVRSVCGGEAMVLDAIDLGLTLRHPRKELAAFDGKLRPWWWKPNLAGLARIVEAAGFELIAQPQRLYMKPGAGQPLPPIRPRALLNRTGREYAIYSLRGDPHAIIRARPRR